MTTPIARDAIYRHRRFRSDVIELCVRWYLTYKLSYRDLVAMMAERGVKVSHTSIMRWVLHYVPEYEKRWARYALPVGSSWRMDETSVPIRGGHYYLYRAVDKYGKSVGSLLRPDRNVLAAQEFFRQAVSKQSSVWPSKVNLDGNAASHLALRLLCREDSRWQSVLIRNRRYLNNIIEQDHRAIKRRCRPMLNLKSFRTAAVTLAGVELAHRIKKRQFSIDCGEGTRAKSLKHLWGEALAERQATGSISDRQCTRTQRNKILSETKIFGVGRFRHARKLAFGGGLYLLIKPNGGRLWRYKYHFNGKEKSLSLGIYRDVPVEIAKVRHQYARSLLAEGVNPSDHKQNIGKHAFVRAAYEWARQYSSASSKYPL